MSGWAGLATTLPSSWRLPCSSSQSLPACPLASFCCWRQRPISGRPTPRRSSCCRKQWSTALAISFFWQCRSSSSPGWSWSAVVSACGSSGSFTRWSATGAAGSSQSPLRACMSFPAYLGPNRRAWRRAGRACPVRCASAPGLAVGRAVLAASAIMGETVPPSIAMLIVGSITSVSLAALFIGGLIPAAVMALCLMVLIYVRARRAGTPRVPRASFATIFRAGLDAVLPLLMPAMLLGGILFGVATPTEVAAFAVVYGLALAVIVYRVMNFGEFMRTVAATAALTGVLLFIFAAASGFSWTLTVAYLPQRLVALLHAVGNSTEIFMLGSIALLVVVGVLLEGLPSLNVLAPLLIPIAGK